MIFYSGAAQQANAEALAELLSITTVVDSAEFQVPLLWCWARVPVRSGYA